MPTLQEIELRAQLARRDERILELEKQLEKQTFRANKFEGALRTMRTSSAHIDRLKIANERIHKLEKQRGQLLDVIERAVRRLEIARVNGESVMPDWVADDKAVIASVKAGA